MKIRRVAVLAACLACILTVSAPPATAAATPATGKCLDVPRRAQQQSKWCWAACAQMVMEKAGHAVTQCAQAINRCAPHPCPCVECPTSSSNPCNPNLTTPTCNTGGFPDFTCFGFAAKHTDAAALPWGALKSEINAGRPFLGTWRYITASNGSGNDGHMVVVVGYQAQAGEKYVRYVNPLTQGAACGATEEQKITYAAYQSGPSWTHWDDYYDIRSVAPQGGCVQASIPQASR